jgi:hypothetical protein
MVDYIYTVFALMNAPFPMKAPPPPQTPYMEKINEKWELIAFLINNFFFQKSYSKNERIGAFIRANTASTLLLPQILGVCPRTRQQTPLESKHTFANLKKNI